MASKHTIDRLLSEMQALYSVPRGVDDDSFIAELGRELEQYTDIELRDAWQNIKDKHEYASYPRLPTFHQAVARIRAARQASELKAQGPRNHWADAENFMRRWFEERRDKDLIGRAEIEDWKDDLANYVKGIAWQRLVGRSNRPLDAVITIPPDAASYYAAQARAKRLAKERRDKAIAEGTWIHSRPLGKRRSGGILAQAEQPE